MQDEEPSSKPNGRALFLLGWPTLSSKHRYQLEHFCDVFEYVDCLTADSLGDTERTISAVDRKNLSCTIVKKGLLARLAQVASRLLVRRAERRYAILAPCGRFTVAYLLLCFVGRVTVVVVEWGSIADLSKLDAVTRASMRLAYKSARCIWYKEPYMEPLLVRLTKRPRFFLPNAVARLAAKPGGARNGATFVWVNRMVGRRHADVVADAFVRVADRRPDVSLVMAGALDESKLDADGVRKQRYVQNLRQSRMRVTQFADPWALYFSGRFFVLIADEIYGNNSLLEAMSAGLVPIVNDRPGVKDLLTSGVDSIVVEDESVAALTDALLLASDMPEEAWSRMSERARVTVATAASVESWRSRFDVLMYTLEK